MSRAVHVVPLHNCWAVKDSDIILYLNFFQTKQEAIDFAREWSKIYCEELVIHNEDGTIAQKDSHGNDPFPPRG